jgi:hypothetical protein
MYMEASPSSGTKIAFRRIVQMKLYETTELGRCNARIWMQHGLNATEWNGTVYVYRVDGWVVSAIYRAGEVGWREAGCI